MKGPIALDRSALSGFITLLLMQRDETEVTLTPEESKALGIEELGLDCTAEYEDDGRITSITLTIIGFED